MIPADFLRSLWWRGLAALRVPGAAFSVRSEWDTLSAIGERRASLARYGDGEMEIMMGRGIHFQEYDRELARRLREILRAPSSRFLVGIPNFSALQINSAVRRQNWERYRLMFSHLIRRGAEYHSAFISRPAGIVGLESAAYFQAFEPIWSGRDVVLIHHSADTATHPLFRQAQSISHLACAPQHAFREYPALLERASAHLRAPETLFLIAAGPTAGVLAWDLAQRGAQALDIGHLTKSYDWFLRKK
jgi:glycosyltransferase family protein